MKIEWFTHIRASYRDKGDQDIGREEVDGEEEKKRDTQPIKSFPT